MVLFLTTHTWRKFFLTVNQRFLSDLNSTTVAQLMSAWRAELMEEGQVGCKLCTCMHSYGSDFLVTDWRVICYLLSFPSIKTTHGNVGKILELKRLMKNLITALTRT